MNLKKISICFFIYVYIISVICNCIYATEENIQNEQNSGEMVIYSESAILMESKTGKVLYEKNMNERKYPASTTKILTAIIALEKCELNETAVASANAVNAIKSGYTKANIQVGETFTIEQLLNVMMVQSANEAATIIAEHISGSVEEFSKLMNQKAQEIGCKNSNFVNANGIHNDNHYSTAYDLALIARYCMKNDKFRSLANMMECSLPRTEFWQDEQVEENGERIFKNTNKLLLSDNKYYYPYAIGIKTGFTTPAKNCLISASNKNGFETIAVVLHAEATEEGESARYLDTINLFEYGYNNYKLDDILKEYPNVAKENETKQPLALTSENNDDTPEPPKIPEDEIDITPLVQIVFGIILLAIAMIIFIKKGGNKKGKHGYSSNIYKFNLN